MQQKQLSIHHQNYYHQQQQQQPYQYHYRQIYSSVGKYRSFSHCSAARRGRGRFRARRWWVVVRFGGGNGRGASPSPPRAANRCSGATLHASRFGSRGVLIQGLWWALRALCISLVGGPRWNYPMKILICLWFFELNLILICNATNRSEKNYACFVAQPTNISLFHKYDIYSYNFSSYKILHTWWHIINS